MDCIVEEGGTESEIPLSDKVLTSHEGPTQLVSVSTSQFGSVSIQSPNQPSVIQTTPSIQTVNLNNLPKGNLIFVKSAGTVIQSPGGGQTLQTLQVLPSTVSDDSKIQYIQLVEAPDDGNQTITGDIPPKRREVLTRRPSYRKILNELSDDMVLPTSLPAGSTSEGQTLQTLTMTSGGTVVHYAQGHDGQNLVIPSEDLGYRIKTVNAPQATPLVLTSANIHNTEHVVEEASRKREIRLLKNSDAARECRRKKKEYIKCLENRVAVLESQNRALIEELKSLKELYCYNGEQ